MSIGVILFNNLLIDENSMWNLTILSRMAAEKLWFQSLLSNLISIVGKIVVNTCSDKRGIITDQSSIVKSGK